MNSSPDCCGTVDLATSGRRTMLKAVLGVAFAATGIGVPRISPAAAMTRAQRDKLAPADVLEMLKHGNERFRSGRMRAHDYLAQKRSSAAGQYPAATILGCIDSRAPAEIILDTGIGDTFNARVAGNIANDDLVGSLEFACAAAGAKLILVLGHTSCGAIKGAIDNVELGHLTGLLAKIRPAVDATAYAGERSSKNAAFVDAVAKTNVQRTMQQIRAQSSTLADLEKSGKILIAGAMYQLVGGRVEFLD